MEISTKNLGKNVSFTLEFYGKTLQLIDYNGVIDSVLVDTNLGVYGYSVKFINAFNKEQILNFIDKKIVGKNHIGENLEILNIHE
jgi:hypothetical protein